MNRRSFIASLCAAPFAGIAGRLGLKKKPEPVADWPFNTKHRWRDDRSILSAIERPAQGLTYEDLNDIMQLHRGKE